MMLIHTQAVRLLFGLTRTQQLQRGGFPAADRRRAGGASRDFSAGSRS